MGRRSKAEAPPAPPAVVKPPALPTEIDVASQADYMRQTMDDQFQMQDTILTSPMTRKKKKPNEGSTMMSSY
tara:strand:- start:9636 stop:9851 length:216 start_codon:yes stop_codon:yes gene_type:complete